MGVCSGIQNLGFRRLFLSTLWTWWRIWAWEGVLYIFTFSHGGLLRDPESGLEMAYFEQYMDSIRLIIHFNKGSAQGSRIWAWDGLFCPIYGLETANFTFLNIYIFTFLHGGLLRGSESGLETAFFVQYLVSRCLIYHFYIFTFLHFYMGDCSGVQILGLRRLILSNIWSRDV